MIIERGFNASGVRYLGDFAFFLSASVAYLFCEKIGSHNKYHHFEDRNCQTRIVRIARTIPVHQNISHGRQEGYVAASRIPMVSLAFR